MPSRPELAPPPAAPPAPDEGAPLVGLDAAVFKSVRVALRARLGEVALSVEELLALKSGQVLQLDRMLGEPLELLLNDTLVARGEIVAVDDHFAIRLTDVAAS